MNRKFISEKWDSFARALISLDVSADKRDAMEVAFYGGTQALLIAMNEEYSRNPDPAAGRKFFADVQDELDAFTQPQKTLKHEAKHKCHVCRAPAADFILPLGTWGRWRGVNARPSE